jgi:hypothetical protein
MGETANIAKLAELAFSQIFKTFGWVQVGPTNSAWECAAPRAHRTKTGEHPSDAVFGYDDPYLPKQILVNLDFKSYKRATLEKLELSSALRNLAAATECANKSEGFQKRFAVTENAEAVGMLFVFNHDNEYNAERFDKVLASVSEDARDISRQRRLFVLGPGSISYLASVATDLELIGAKELRDYERSFFFPNLIGYPAKANNAASVECLTGPWIVARFSGAAAKKPDTHYHFYYRGRGASPQEFEYLLDYLFRYQLVDEYARTHFRLVAPDPEAALNFEAAKRFYLGRFHNLSEFKERLDRIDYAGVTRIAQTFSSDEVGMAQRL